MRPVWMHDLRLAWRHREIRKEVILLTIWKAAFWVGVAILMPITIPLLVIHVAGNWLSRAAEISHDALSVPMIWLKERRTPYYKPIREKLEAKGAMQWQMRGEIRLKYSDNPRADG